MSRAIEDEFERYRLRRRAEHQSLKRLGVPNVRCLCGETHPDAFEKDHIDRRKNSDVVWGLCKNCHAKKSARERVEGPPVGLHPGNPYEAMGHALLGMHLYLSFIAERLPGIANVMFKLADEGIAFEE